MTIGGKPEGIQCTVAKGIQGHLRQQIRSRNRLLTRSETLLTTQRRGALAAISLPRRCSIFPSRQPCIAVRVTRRVAPIRKNSPYAPLVPRVRRAGRFGVHPFRVMSDRPSFGRMQQARLPAGTGGTDRTAQVASLSLSPFLPLLLLGGGSAGFECVLRGRDASTFASQVL